MYNSKPVNWLSAFTACPRRAGEAYMRIFLQAQVLQVGECLQLLASTLIKAHSAAQHELAHAARHVPVTQDLCPPVLAPTPCRPIEEDARKWVAYFQLKFLQLCHTMKLRASVGDSLQGKSECQQSLQRQQRLVAVVLADVQLL